ncbi:MAG: hydrolase [Candidatus Eremiobacteraeota bacterium]|nr:hydrolase [Candidatus Eremiobacteraeota bacterium]
MAVTALDRNVALVVIDIQKGIVRRQLAHPVDDVVQNVVRLVESFRAKERPVALVHVGWSKGGGDALHARTEPQPAAGPLPEDFFEYVDALRADPERDILIHKRQWGAFYGTDLDLQLRRRGVTNIVLCGIATSIGVESTARDAWERGYNLTFVSDAMTDMNADAHERALRIIFPRIGEIGTTQEVLAF